MAASPNSADKKRTGPGGPVPVDLPGHHCPEAADRGRRQQRRPLQVRETRQIRHQVQIRSCLAVQLPSARPQGFRDTDHREAIPSSSRKLDRSRAKRDFGAPRRSPIRINFFFAVGSTEYWSRRESAGDQRTIRRFIARSHGLSADSRSVVRETNGLYSRSLLLGNRNQNCTSRKF